MHAIVFWIKKLCDRYLYGQVLIPSKHCPGCGYPLKAGEVVTPPYHAKCFTAPKEIPAHG